MNPTPLSTIARWAGGQLSGGDANALITRVCTDTRSLQAGDLFVAIRGEKFDGHDYLATAASVGAAAALAENTPAELPAGFGLVQVAEAVRGLQNLSAGYRGTLSVKVVAITGSNGKTSTKDLAAAVLNQRFLTSKTAGNLNNHLGVPLTLLSLHGADQVAVVEMGMNHPGEIAPLAALARPDVAIITNIGMAHIEFMGSREAIAEEKGTLAEAVTERGTVILNADDDMTPRIAARCRGRILTAGIQAGDVRASNLRPTKEGMEFDLSFEDKTVPAVLSVHGEHMVRNAALACAAGITFGLSLADCAAGLRNLQLSKGRLQQKELAGFIVLDDSYNANPDSVVAGLATLAAMPGEGRRIAVLGRMGELGDEAERGHRRVGAAAGAQKLACVIAVGEQTEWIAEEARAGGAGHVLHVPDTDSAVTALKTFGAPGDVVLVKGSRSAKMERVVEALEKEGPALMLYYLHQLSEGATSDFLKAFNVFQYITFRSVFAALTAFVLSLLLGNFTIRKLLSLKLGQPIRSAEEVNKLFELHGKKAGTPTMGGILLLGTTVIATLLWARTDNSFVWLVLGSMVAAGLLGFADDYLKVSKKNSAGVRERTKLIVQGLIAIAVTWFFLADPQLNVQASALFVPFYKKMVVENMGWVITFLFFSAIIMGTSNGVNLTDGLDGLATGCTLTVTSAYAVLAYIAGNHILADYLQVPFYPQAGELTVFCMALGGAALGFLWFNAHPAKMFMGDTGSLAIGGAVGVVAICTKQELLLAIIGFVFVAEAVSVLLQRFYFKYTKRKYGEGRRIFKMAPLHHHFELSGWKETAVVTRFWIVSFVCALLGLATLKLR